MCKKCQKCSTNDILGPQNHVFEIFLTFSGGSGIRRLQDPIWHFVLIVFDIFRGPSQAYILTFLLTCSRKSGKALLHWGRPVTALQSAQQASPCLQHFVRLHPSAGSCPVSHTYCWQKKFSDTCRNFQRPGTRGTQNKMHQNHTELRNIIWP